MKKYNVWVRLELDGVYEAENEEEAFVMASDDAMAGGDWSSIVEEVEDFEE